MPLNVPPVPVPLFGFGTEGGPALMRSPHELFFAVIPLEVWSRLQASSVLTSPYESADITPSISCRQRFCTCALTGEARKRKKSEATRIAPVRRINERLHLFITLSPRHSARQSLFPLFRPHPSLPDPYPPIASYHWQM